MQGSVPRSRIGFGFGLRFSVWTLLAFTRGGNALTSSAMCGFHSLSRAAATRSLRELHVGTARLYSSRRYAQRSYLGGKPLFLDKSRSHSRAGLEHTQLWNSVQTLSLPHPYFGFERTHALSRVKAIPVPNQHIGVERCRTEQCVPTLSHLYFKRRASSYVE